MDPRIKKFASRTVPSLGAGLLLLLAGCASFDTTYTDHTELERSQWGGITKPERTGYSGPFGFPSGFPSDRLDRKALEENLRQQINSFHFPAPCPAPASPR